jgi:hypothetical protein
MQAAVRIMLVVAASALAACGDGPTGSGKETPPSNATPAFTSAILTAGGEGVVTGTSLDRLPSAITVDGRSVTLTSKSATEARFAMPASLPCEVDGRPVRIEAGSASITQPLKVTTTLSMQLGESRVLDPAQAGCVQLPGGGSEYVLTTLHPGQERVSGTLAPDTFFTVRTITGEATSALTAAPSLAPMGPPAMASAHDLPQPRRARMAAASPYSENPIPFDPRYATAGVGDRVRFVDWDASFTDPFFCDRPKSQVPAYEVEIIAVVGKTVIAVDLRMKYSAEYTTAEMRAHYQKAAAIVDPVVIPTMRAVFDPAFEPLRGGGGRHYLILTNTIPPSTGTPDGGTYDPQSTCAPSSEMPTAFSYAASGWKPVQPDDWNASNTASVYVHEYAHIADWITRDRKGTLATHSWFTEPYAVQAEETAARLGAGKLTGAKQNELTGKAAGGGSYLFSGLWGQRAAWSPYDYSIPDDRMGNYAQGASMVLFARERVGDLGGGQTKPLYLRQLERGSWNFAGLAAEAGMSPQEFHAAWMLAYATDDLAAENSGLPRFTTWDNSALAKSLWPSARQGRTVMAAGNGNFAALYFLNRRADSQQRGSSFQIEGITGKGSTVRLTRIR